MCVPVLTPGNLRPVHSLFESQREKLGLPSPADTPRLNAPEKAAASVIQTAKGSSKMEKSAV